MSVSLPNFDYIAASVKEASGILLTRDKIYLMQSRLGEVLKKHECSSVDALALKLRGTDAKKVLRDVVDALTTNESLFFRDGKPFESLAKEVIPALQKEPVIRILSAACSTGQEAFSTAITLYETQPAPPQWLIDGTDICTDALQRANEGMFSQFEVQRGMPDKYLSKYFDRQGSNWKIKPTLKKNIRFDYGNLLDKTACPLRYHIVFCRNVLIYFDKETKETALQNIISKTAPGGFLFLGGSENLIGLRIGDKYDRFGTYPALYRKKD